MKPAMYENVSLAEGFTGSSGFEPIPYIKKYNQGFGQPGQTNVNFPVICYADMMLMIAECLNEQGYVANGEAFNLPKGNSKSACSVS